MLSAVELAIPITKLFEGLRLEPYHDPVGFPTIGYGYLLSREKWASLDHWPSITEEKAEELLVSELEEKAEAVFRLMRPGLEDHEKAALIDFSYNVGAGALKASTLRARINRYDPNAHEEFRKWVYSSGRKLPGLIRRRLSEERLFVQERLFRGDYS